MIIPIEASRIDGCSDILINNQINVEMIKNFSTDDLVKRMVNLTFRN